jgi:hypothetical protein
VLRALGMRHHLEGGVEQPAIYRVNDDVVFEVEVQECADGVCGPYL